MKPEWLLYAETIRKEIDDMPAEKSGKNVERRLLDTYRRAQAEKQYPGSLGDWEVLMRRLGRS
jgi:hypothetical protein